MNLINAAVFDGEKIIEKGYVSFENGVITGCGEMSGFNAAGECEDLSGRFVMPGLIDAHTHVGMWGDASGFEDDDGNEDTDPVTPQLLGLDGVKLFDRCFGDALNAGVTTVLTGPGSSNPAGGVFAALKTGGELSERTVCEKAGLKIAFGENPKASYRGKDRPPVTRMANASLLRELFAKARRYSEDIARADGDDEVDPPDYDIKLEAAAAALDGRMPVFAHAHRADDILTAVRIAKEFGLRLVIVHGTDAARISSLLASENIPVLCGPVICDRGKPELAALSPATAGQLCRAGVKTAIISDHPVVPVQYLTLSAALCVKNGMDRLDALRGLTSSAADICGLEKLGRLEKGFCADIAVFDSDPLMLMSRCERVYISGVRAL